MSFLNTILESTKEVESPQRYFYWAGITALSSVLGRKVSVDRQGKYFLYPNIYVFLVSKRSGLRKSPSVNMCRKLLHLQGNIRIIDGQNSIQGVIKELSQVHTTDMKCIISKAEGLLISGEFANFLIADRDSSPLTNLTDLYDTQNYEEGWSKRLVSQDKMKLNGLCLSGLFASNEVHFRDAVPDSHIRGGFLARCFVVYEEKKNKPNSLMLDNEEDEKIVPGFPYTELVQYLNEVYKLSGLFRITNEARQFYNDWYYEFEKKEIEDETGTIDRIGDTILKAAMCIAVSNKPELVIEVDAMEEAILKTVDCFLGTRRLTFIGKQDDVKSTTLRIIMASLISASDHQVQRKILTRKGLGVFDTFSMDSVLEQLIESKMIKARKLPNGEWNYKLEQWVVDRYSKIEGD